MVAFAFAKIKFAFTCKKDGMAFAVLKFILTFVVFTNHKRQGSLLTIIVGIFYACNVRI